MAFVSKQPRRVFEVREEYVDRSPQPMEKARKAKKLQKSSRSPAPFNSSCQRSKERKMIKPGPGSYNLSRNMLKENMLEECLDTGMKVIEPTKPTTVFKSKTIRFGDGSTSSPGPGAYQYIKANRPQSKAVARGPNRIIEFLKAQQRPKQGNIMGLNVNLKELELTIEPPNAEKEKEFPSPFFRSTVERNIIERPRTTLGPGSYNLLDDFLKPRTSEFKQRPAKTASLARCESTKYQSQDQTQSHVEIEQPKKTFDVNVGPGYYYNAQMHSSFRAKTANQCMGSRVQRFCPTKESQLGPGAYHVRSENSTSETVLKSSFFRSTQKRFKDCGYDTKGPGMYNPNNSFNDRLKVMKKRGPTNIICGKSNRFTSAKRLDTPGPGAYEPQMDMSPMTGIQRPATSNVQRVCPRSQFLTETTDTPAPGSYDLNQYTIESKIRVRKNDEYIHSAPFMTCQQRFKEPRESHPQPQEEVQIRSHPSSAIKKPVVLKAPFQSSDQRFKFPLDSAVPDPTVPIEAIQKYNVQEPLNKPSFNVMFCR